MKQRLDELLVERGQAVDLQNAQALIMAGEVTDEFGKRLDKSGLLISADEKLRVKDRSNYVSRGANKLDSVTKELGLDFNEKIVLDVGQSTGGFTDYALKHRAARVIGVDVGTNQLDWRLRQDPRVEAHERTDIREFTGDAKADIALVDVSFVSLTKILPAIADHLKPDRIIVALLKPQFEASKSVADSFKGVITDETVRAEIIKNFEDWLDGGFEILAAADSKMAGSRGNIERFYKLAPKR